MTEVRDTASVIAPPPLLALAAILLGLLLDWLMPAFVLRLLLSWPTRLVIALLCGAAAAALAIPALLAFRRAGTHVEPWRASTALVTDGVFAWLRNPMYVGLTSLLTGLAVILASDWMLVMTVAFALTIHFGVVKREERYLETKFGNVFRAYRARVSRYGWPSD
jgi:protein-S-isoprenylcysteine O-methyltransferase Ste14